MYKVSYMGNGTTTEYTFNFPYFENSNIVVTKNGTPATGCSIVGNSGGLDADYPYTGGTVVFEKAPSSLDCITIVRQLPLNRIADYQPTARIEPTILNQDLNYLMEAIKDRKDELEALRLQYADIADKESTDILLSRITAIHNEIAALGDLSQVRTGIASLKDGANFTNTGKANIAHLGMPSGQWDNLTLGASGTRYTAPADGYFALMLSAQNLDEYCNLYVESPNGQYIYGVTNHPTHIGYNQGQIVPVSKGCRVQIVYTMSGNINYFKFIYANGSL